MLRAEVSIFPSADDSRLTHPTRRFMEEMGLDFDIRHDPASLNTALSGSSAHVFGALQRLVDATTAQDRDMVMVVTFYSTAY